MRTHVVARALSSAPVSTKEWFVFPRQSEGNIYAVNWSLVEDGIISKGDAFRNGRVPLLTARLPKKIENGKLSLDGPTYFGDYAVVESGEGISPIAFADKKETLQNLLSKGSDIFVEDGGLGAFSPIRAGARIVADNAALALILKNLLIATPPRPVDHRARYDGWNLDERWITEDMVWNGTNYVQETTPTDVLPGQRPVLAIVAGPGAEVAVEFVERGNKIVGGTVLAGSAAPVRGLVQAIGLASCVLINERRADALAIACLTVTKGSETVVIVGADDAAVESSLAAGTLYGAYHNVIVPGVGVSALWGGVIGPSTTVSEPSSVPSVVVGGKMAISTSPNNLCAPMTHLVFVEKGAKKASLSEAEATSKLLALVDESKAGIAGELVKGIKVTVVGDAKDALL